MIIKIQRHSKNFVIIDKRPLEDVRLTWKAKGLLAYLLTKPHNWVVMRSDLVERSKNGRRAFQSAMKELKLYGYATLSIVRDEGGNIRGKEWIIHEEPVEYPTDA